MLPDRTPKRGGQLRDHRQVIDAIAFEYRTGTPWMDLPRHSGPMGNAPPGWACPGAPAARRTETIGS
ncbi:transposase [Streptomyces sp. NPDC018584]|uniref:transposase n=1 Tax=unclassified Streptomyces TaxID=2593676 RepID=UPI00379B0FDD